MKYIYLLILLFLTATIGYSQSYVPEGINYQAVVYDEENLNPGLDAKDFVLRNQNVSIRFTIIETTVNGNEVFQETHTTKTDNFGLFSIIIGKGTQISSNAFSAITWGKTAHFLKVEIDKKGESNYINMGVQELWSVPYSLSTKYAENAGNGIIAVSDNGDGTMTFDYQNGSKYTTPKLVGLTGPKGDIGLTGAQGVQGVKGDKGETGSNGTNGTDGKTVLNGTSDPNNSQGVNGDFYFNTTNNTLFGPKSNNVWPSEVSLIGPQGATGAQGASGLLTSGIDAGNTPYWNGSQWVINSSNLFNNGSNIGLGTTTPNTSAKIEVNSTTQGFLPPRMTSLQRDAISLPAIGLMIYNTTVNCIQWWNGIVWFDGCGNNPYLQYSPGTVFCASGATMVLNVTSPTTGKIWMDRNLGASQVASSSTDQNAYGDLYQWGRGADGHQCRTSFTTETLSTTDVPGNANFITNNSGNLDWRSIQNDNLWQGVNGVNNPCPSGYRIPTLTEMDAERLSWSANNSIGAFASPLKLPVTGYRKNSDGLLYDVNLRGFYWSNTISGTRSRELYFNNVFSNVDIDYRAYGFSIRCIKD